MCHKSLTSCLFKMSCIITNTYVFTSQRTKFDWMFRKKQKKTRWNSYIKKAICRNCLCGGRMKSCSFTLNFGAGLLKPLHSPDILIAESFCLLDFSPKSYRSEAHLQKEAFLLTFLVYLCSLLPMCLRSSHICTIWEKLHCKNPLHPYCTLPCCSCQLRSW